MSTGPDLDLRGRDHAARRRYLFAALRDLQPGEELVLLSAQPDDLRWLRYEMEARIDRRYRWSPGPTTRAPEVRTVVRLAG